MHIIAETKAWSVTLMFVVVGIVGALSARGSDFLMPHVLFYATLVINTFYSVRFFAPIQAVHVWQTLIDLALLALYVALALSIGNAYLFSFLALLMFIAASAKYALMLELVPHGRVLKRKILIDICGVLLCALSFGGVALGYPAESAWALAIVFIVANIYLLHIKPMYRLTP